VTSKVFPPQVLRGVEVAVASSRSATLLAVRQAFVRYFHHVLARPVPVAVVPHEVPGTPYGLASSDAEMIERCLARAGELAGRLAEAYQFYVAVEEGLETVPVDGQVRHYVRTWAAIRGLERQACGASGSLEVPARLLEERVEEGGERRMRAGMRRHPGLVSTLSGGLDSRRSAAAIAVFHAVASLFFEHYSGHPRGSR
jgi:non-canonical (house-cleaning) NTP pyrophosphatase